MRYGIRGIFVATTTICVVVAYLAWVYRNERVAVTQLSEFGSIHVEYEAFLPLLPRRVSQVGLFGEKGTDAASIRMIGKLRKLRTLKLDMCSVSHDDIAALHPMPSLEEVTLSACRKVDDRFVDIVVQNAPNLRVLNLEATGITNRSLSTISTLDKLEVLILSRNKAIDGSVEDIAKHCKRLTKLDLTKTNVSDESLVGIEECTKLREVSLRDTLVSDAIVHRVIQIKSLEKISVWNTNVTADGVNELQLAIPKVTIEHGGRRY